MDIISNNLLAKLTGIIIIITANTLQSYWISKIRDQFSK